MQKEIFTPALLFSAPENGCGVFVFSDADVHLYYRAEAIPAHYGWGGFCADQSGSFAPVCPAGDWVDMRRIRSCMGAVSFFP